MILGSGPEIGGIDYEGMKLERDRKVYVKAKNPDGKEIYLEGKEINEKGNSIHLDSLILEERRPGEKEKIYSNILFETESGNIYRLYQLPSKKPEIALISARDSKRKRKLQGRILPQKEFESLQVTVGKPFNKETTNVVRITAFKPDELIPGWSHKPSSSSSEKSKTLDDMVRENHTDIIERYEKMIKS